MTIEFNTQETDENGDTIVTFTLDSNLLPWLNVDTYHSFNGDSWLECETEGYIQEGQLREGEELNVQYDWSGIIRELAEANIDWLTSEFPDVFQSIEVISTYSPREYNFQTDSFRAEYTVNWSAFLRAYREQGAKSAHEWLNDNWRSQDGFISFVPSWWDNDELACKRWLAFNWWLTVAIADDESLFLHVAESEHDAYILNTIVTLPERDDS